jgi:hypothetical protein
MHSVRADRWFITWAVTDPGNAAKPILQSGATEKNRDISPMIQKR